MKATRSRLLGGEFEFQDQIEELDRIFEGQTPAVMEIRRTLLDAAQRKCLDRPQRGFVHKTLDSEIVHLVIEVERRGMTGGALPLAEEHLFAAPFALGGLRDPAPRGVSFGAGGKSNMFCIWAICETCTRSRIIKPFFAA